MWQPIETAPTDKRILLWCPRMKTAVVAQQMTAMEDGEKSWVYARQLSGNSTHAVAFVVHAPTHWQPIPDDPTPSQGYPPNHGIDARR